MHLATISYQPGHQPIIKNCNQKSSQNFAMVNLGGTLFHHSNHSNHQLNMRSRTNHPQGAILTVCMMQPLQHVQNTTGNKVTITYVHMMSVKQTASWIRTLAVHNGWDEAADYANNFSKNNIYGSMLQHLNHEILKFDMGISNHLHRVYLLATIRQLFPSFDHRRVTSEPTRLSDLRERR